MRLYLYTSGNTCSTSFALALGSVFRPTAVGFAEPIDAIDFLFGNHQAVPRGSPDSVDLQASSPSGCAFLISCLDTLANTSFNVLLVSSIDLSELALSDLG